MSEGSVHCRTHDEAGSIVMAEACCKVAHLIEVRKEKETEKDPE